MLDEVRGSRVRPGQRGPAGVGEGRLQPFHLHDINAVSVLHKILRYRQVTNDHSRMKMVGSLWKSAPNGAYACQQLKCDGLIPYILRTPPVCFQCHRLEAEQAMFRFGDTAAWLSEAERRCPVDPVLDTGTPSA
jgi:hypothetical protein